MTEPMQSTAEARAMKALRDYAKAIHNGDDQEPALNAFETQLDLVSSETRDALEDALARIDDAANEDAFKTYAQIAAKVRNLEGGFKLGTTMVDDATNDLFFPAATSYLAQIAVVLGELKEAADKIKGATANLQGDLKQDDLGGIIEDIGKIKEIADTLVGDFVELKEELPD